MTVIVINIESGVLLGQTKTTHWVNNWDGPIYDYTHTEKTIHKKNFNIQCYPIKISLGVRMWDSKKKKI